MSCRALNCKNSKFKNNKTKSFFAFPKEEHLLSLWLEVSCNTKVFNAKTWFICSDHFSENDILRLQQKKIGLAKKLLLKPGSVPFLKKDSVTNSHHFKRSEKRGNKKLVETLMSESSVGISTVIESPMEVDVIPTEDIPSEIDSSKSFDSGKLIEDIRILQEKLENSEKENLKIKRELWRCQNICEFKVQKLTEELEIVKAEKFSMENQLRKIFTDGQIAQMKKPQKKHHWEENDIAGSITLRRKNFPLPSIRTLQRWSQKVDITPGIIAPVIKILAETKSMAEFDKICVLSFDEMMVRKKYCYDKPTDSTLAPATYVQVGMIRGLMAKWKQPVFYAFDTKLTNAIVTDVVKTLKNIGFNVVALVNDLGGGNRSFFNEIDVNYEKPWFDFEGQKIYVFADVPHLIKLLRNHFLDSGMLIDGKEVNKNIICDLLSCTASDLRITHKISPRHLTVVGSDRQNVKLATKLFSHTIACAISRAASLGHLNGRNWQECYTLFKTTNDWFDVMNVRLPKKDSRERMHAYGQALHVQDQILDSMLQLVENMRVVGRKTLLPFQKGIIQSTTALKLLFSDIKQRFNVKYVLTYRLNQDVLENFFGVIRAKGGLHDHPDRQEFKYRLRSYILGKNQGVLSTGANVEEDDTPDLPDTSNSLTGVIMGSLPAAYEPEPEHDPEEELESMSQLELDGLENLAGYICHRMQTEFPSVAANEDSSFTWVNHLTEGGLSKPSETLMDSLKECDKIFTAINGEGLEICNDYLRKHIQQSAHINCPEKIKKLFFRSRMFFKITQLNMKIADSKYKQNRKRAKVVS